REGEAGRVDPGKRETQAGVVRGQGKKESDSQSHAGQAQRPADGSTKAVPRHRRTEILSGQERSRLRQGGGPKLGRGLGTRGRGAFLGQVEGGGHGIALARVSP